MYNIVGFALYSGCFWGCKNICFLLFYHTYGIYYSFCDLMITYYNYAFLKIHTKKPPNFFCKYKREQSCDRGFRKWAYVFYINVGRAFYKPTKRKNLWSHGQQESCGRLFPRGSETGCVLFWGVRYAGSSSHALRTGRYLNYRF